MLGLALKLPGVPLRARLAGGGTPTPTPPPPPAITNLVIEGDSITFAGGAGGFAYQYAAAPPVGRTATIRAQNSRVVSVGFALDDGGNSLLSHVTEDATTYGAQIVATMIGANDMAVARTAAQYRADLIGLYAQYRARGVKFAWSPPIPYGTNQAHGSYANFTAQRTALLATCRDPAVWSQFADYYIPLGEHPDFAAADNMTLIGSDGVHPTQAGQDALYPVFKAAMDSLLDPARASATTMYGAAWPASETGLATSSPLVRRFVVKGVAHVGLASGVGVTGGGAQVRLNGGAWATSIGRIYNGDVVELRLTTSAGYSTAVGIDLTIGSETRTLSYTTGANVTPAAYAHGDVEYFQPGGSTLAITRTFPADGIAIIAFSGQNGVSSLKVGGVEATPRILQVNAGILVVYTVLVTAGDRAIELTFTGFTNSTALSWGLVANADATPVQIDQGAPNNESNPHNTGDLVISASGIAVGFYSEYAGGTTTTPATVVAGSTFVDEGQGAYQGEVVGIAVATRTTAGAIGFNHGFGSFCRGALVFKAAGT